MYCLTLAHNALTCNGQAAQVQQRWVHIRQLLNGSRRLTADEASRNRLARSCLITCVRLTLAGQMSDSVVVEVRRCTEALAPRCSPVALQVRFACVARRLA